MVLRLGGGLERRAVSRDGERRVETPPVARGTRRRGGRSGALPPTRVGFLLQPRRIPRRVVLLLSGIPWHVGCIGYRYSEPGTGHGTTSPQVETSIVVCGVSSAVWSVRPSGPLSCSSQPALSLSSLQTTPRARPRPSLSDTLIGALRSLSPWRAWRPEAGAPGLEWPVGTGAARHNSPCPGRAVSPRAHVPRAPPRAMQLHPDLAVAAAPRHLSRSPPRPAAPPRASAAAVQPSPAARARPASPTRLASPKLAAPLRPCAAPPPPPPFSPPCSACRPQAP